MVNFVCPTKAGYEQIQNDKYESEVNTVMVGSLYLPVVFLRAVCITEMAEVVVPTQVFKQLIIVKITVITKFAEGVSSVAGVIRVSMCSVLCQFLAVVPFPLVTEHLVKEGKA